MALFQVGSKGDEVKKIQQSINDKNKGVAGYVPLVVDGIYGGKTKSAVQQYQTANKLKVDGIVGDQTRGSLYGTPKVNTTPKIDLTTKATTGTPIKETKPDAFTSTLNQGGYTDSMSPEIKAIWDKINTRESFSYDPTKDEAFQKYKSEALNTAEKAYNNEIGGSTINGIESSSIAEQIGKTAKNAVINSANQAEQTFFDKAYNRYLQDEQGDYDKLKTMLGISDVGYGRAMDGKNYNYQVGRDKVSDSQWNKTFDYNKDMDMTKLTYQQAQDKISNALSQGHLSVSQGNLALSKAKQKSDEDPNSLDNQLKRDTLDANKASKESAAFDNTVSKVDSLYTYKDPVSGVVSVNPNSTAQLRSYIVGLRLSDDQTDQLLLRYGLPVNP